MPSVPTITSRAGKLARADMPDDETEKAGQKIRPEFVEMCFVEHVGIQC